MNRVHLFEFHDSPWFPDSWREIMTGVMAIFAVRFDVYRPLVSRIESAIRSQQTDRIIDLCSGATGPLLLLQERLRTADEKRLKVLLTDKYPNLPAFRRAAEVSEGSIAFVEDSVDATSVPEGLTGFRTLFGSFHHFRPDVAREILRDAARGRQGIGIFEYTERNFWVWGLPVLLTPVFCWMVMPLARPFTWRHLLWTYLIPIVPLLTAWDGFVSCLRTYSCRELRALTEELDVPDYRWEIGLVRSFGACRVTYLLGYPSPTRNGD